MSHQLLQQEPSPWNNGADSPNGVRLASAAPMTGGWSATVSGAETANSPQRCSNRHCRACQRCSGLQSEPSQEFHLPFLRFKTLRTRRVRVSSEGGGEFTVERYCPALNHSVETHAAVRERSGHVFVCCMQSATRRSFMFMDSAEEVVRRLDTLDRREYNGLQVCTEGTVTAPYMDVDLPAVAMRGCARQAGWTQLSAAERARLDCARGSALASVLRFVASRSAVRLGGREAAGDSLLAVRSWLGGDRAQFFTASAPSKSSLHLLLSDAFAFRDFTSDALFQRAVYLTVNAVCAAVSEEDSVRLASVVGCPAADLRLLFDFERNHCALDMAVRG